MGAVPPRTAREKFKSLRELAAVEAALLCRRHLRKSAGYDGPGLDGYGN